MLDYLISLLNFTVNGETYNLFLTPWTYTIAWFETAEGDATQLVNAYLSLDALGWLFSVLVIVLLVVCCWLFYKIASSFTGWLKFR
jgi:hypothetical protein